MKILKLVASPFTYSDYSVFVHPQIVGKWYDLNQHFLRLFVQI